ncbi:MAG TPA: cyclic peptide export ABC transporter [Pyrinomonadaceae bacterium]|nr:cyclic peptide export ABC transporter [Pyrinomonadaceae bacterium]
MKIFGFLLRFSPAIVLVSILLGILSGASHIGILALIAATLTKDPRFSPETSYWALVGLCVLMPLTRVGSELVLSYAGQGAVLRLRMQMSRKILEAPMRHLENIGSPRLYATLTEDVMSITGALMILPLMAINTAIAVGCLVYLGWLSFNILSVVMLFMFVGVITYQIFLRRSIRYQRRSREETDNLFKHFRALNDGAKELKLHNRRRESFFSDLLYPTAASLRGLNLKAVAILTSAASWGQTLFFVLIFFVLFVLPDYDDFSLPVQAGAVLTILYMITPLTVTMNSMPMFTRAGISMGKIEMLGLSLDAHKEKVEASAGEVPEAGWSKLELVGVSHSYRGEREDETFTLGPLSLEFRPGEMVFITGGNGSGKTTLAKLIMGLYIPEAGEIRLDGVPVTDATRDAYRQHFSAVFSDFHLFESLLGVDAPDLDDKARHYLRQLHLQNKVRIREGQLSTTDLSQGQRKRLALLTAYLENRPVYVFDEWAADQDPQFKETFYYDLLPALKARGKTVLVITHDDRFYHMADRVVKLDYGQIQSDRAAGRRPVSSMTAAG